MPQGTEPWFRAILRKALDHGSVPYAARRWTMVPCYMPQGAGPWFHAICRKALDHGSGLYAKVCIYKVGARASGMGHTGLFMTLGIRGKRPSQKWSTKI
jgi:hypothetical protein